MSGLLGSGDLYFDRYSDTGASTGYVSVGNATVFSIKENAELKERISKQRDTFGQALDAVYIKQPAEITVTIDEASRENLAMALLGTGSVVAAGSPVAVTNEPITAAHDRAVKLANENVSTVVVTNTAGTTTYVVGTDYTVNARLGLVTALSTGAITDAQALHVDYSHTTPAQIVVSGSVQPVIHGRFLLDGKNQVTGKDVRVECEARVSPTEAVDFLSGDFVPMTLQGKIVGGYTVRLKS